MGLREQAKANLEFSSTWLVIYEILEILNQNYENWDFLFFYNKNTPYSNTQSLLGL
jgi:hypothetical protein